MPFDPNTAQLMTEFDPSSAQVIEENYQHPQVDPQKTNTPKEIINSTVNQIIPGLDIITNRDSIDSINAFGGGVAKGLVKAGGAIGGLATDIASSSGMMSPETRDKFRNVGRSVGNFLTPGEDSIPGQAMQQHPNFATAGDITGQVLPYSIPGAGLASRGNTALSGLAGAANTQDGMLNRVTGAAFGAGTYKLLEGLMEAGKVGVQALRASDTVKKVSDTVKNSVSNFTSKLSGSPRQVGAQSAAKVYEVTRQADDELFNQFRQASGDYTKDIRVVKRAAEDLLDDVGTNLSGSQKQVIQRIIQQSDSAKNIADLHDMQKFLASQRKTFFNQDGQVFINDYNKLQGVVASKMEEVASKAGVLPEYKNAVTHYKEKLLPLINYGTDDVFHALSETGKTTNPSKAAEILDTWVDKNILPDSPEQTKAFLSTLDDVGRDAVETRTLQRIIEKVENAPRPELAFNKELNKLGLTKDVLFSGTRKEMIQGAQRILKEASPLLKNSLQRGQILNYGPQMAMGAVQKAFDTRTGQFILKLLGQPSTPKTFIEEFLKQGAAIGGGILGGKVSQESTNFAEDQEIK